MNVARAHSMCRRSEARRPQASSRNALASFRSSVSNPLGEPGLLPRLHQALVGLWRGALPVRTLASHPACNALAPATATQARSAGNNAPAALPSQNEASRARTSADGGGTSRTHRPLRFMKRGRTCRYCGDEARSSAGPIMLNLALCSSLSEA